MKSTALTAIPPEVLTDSPQHIQKLVELRKALAESVSEFLQAAQYQKECKKQVDADQTKLNNYINDLTEEKMFDKKVNEVKHAKTEPEELKPVWPFPLPEGMKNTTLADIAQHDKVKGLGSMVVASFNDKSIKTAGDVEKVCCGEDGKADPKKAISQFLKDFGQRHGCLILNALAEVKAGMQIETKAKSKDWPFTVEPPFDKHAISQVASKFAKQVTTAASAKLAEANLTVLADLNELLKAGDCGPLTGLIGPAPAKKLIDAVGKYVAEVQ